MATSKSASPDHADLKRVIDEAHKSVKAHRAEIVKAAFPHAARVQHRKEVDNLVGQVLEDLEVLSVYMKEAGLEYGKPAAAKTGSKPAAAKGAREATTKKAPGDKAQVKPAEAEKAAA